MLKKESLIGEWCVPKGIYASVVL